MGLDNLSDYEPKSKVLLNLGYSQKNRETIDITFNTTHQVSFKSVKLIAMPFNRSYDQKVHQVQRQGLQNAKVSDDRVTGDLTTNQASVLATSIPYSTGWRLTVDGKTTPTQVVNDGFVGAELGAGTHHIKLTYRTPGLRVGALLSAVGIVCLGLSSLWIWWRRPMNRKH